MVEKNVAGAYTEILYSSVGKTATMSGQTTVSAYLPLPAGETLLETGSTGCTKYFWHKDWLGTTRFGSALGTRTSAFDRAFAPFGEMYDNFGVSSQLGFTGDTQDTIAGLFDTPNRELSPNQGRWISPDPSGMDAADSSNPQSWNRYAYVLNNPLSNSDPTGLWCYYGATNDAGGIDLDNSDAADSRNYDFNTTQAECEGAGGSNGGTWYADSTDTVNVDGGSPSMVDTITSTVGGAGNQILNTAQEAGYSALNWLLSPRNPGCMAAATAGGAGTGMLVGGGIGSLGFAGGPAGFLTTPAGAETGSLIGGGVGFAGGMIHCAKGISPNFGGNQRQNRQANDAKREAERETNKKMTDAQERLFHNIDKTEMDYQGMVQLAKDILDKVVNMP
jgi:RHS repeat-associated protein